MVHRKHFFVLAIVFLGVSHLARAGELPRRVGECAKTTIKSIGSRLKIPGSGSAVTFENGGGQVSYDTVAAIEHSKKGDPVRMCLVSSPTN